MQLFPKLHSNSCDYLYKSCTRKLYFGKGHHIFCVIINTTGQQNLDKKFTNGSITLKFNWWKFSRGKNFWLLCSGYARMHMQVWRTLIQYHTVFKSQSATTRSHTHLYDYITRTLNLSSHDQSCDRTRQDTETIEYSIDT
jgi:hypothetical protein